MSGIKVVHCADFHFGAAFSIIPEKSKQRQDEQMKTFKSIINLCNAINAHLLLIAGDFFDSNFVSEDIFQSIIWGFKNLKHTKVFIAPGNHDPASIDSIYLNRQWPENVTIFKGEAEYVELEDIKARVWGCAFNSYYSHEQIMKDFFVVDDDFVNVMVLHGEKILNGQKSKYNPISNDFIRESKMDYIALGHNHTATSVSRIGKTHYAYCGSPEPLGFDETGPHGALVLAIKKDFCECDFAQLSYRKYIVEDIDVGKCSTQEDIATTIKDNIVNKYGVGWNKNLYKITITGALAIDFIPSIPIINSILGEDVYYLEIFDKTKVKANMELISKENSLRGAFVRQLLIKRDNFNRIGDVENAKKCTKALNVGLRAFEGEVVIDEY